MLHCQKWSIARSDVHIGECVSELSTSIKWGKKKKRGKVDRYIYIYMYVRKKNDENERDSCMHESTQPSYHQFIDATSRTRLSKKSKELEPTNEEYFYFTLERCRLVVSCLQEISSIHGSNQRYSYLDECLSHVRVARKNKVDR